MLFSIITASYNSEKTITKTIESVISQTYTNLEYIIVDGASNDRTVKIIKSYEPILKEKGIIFKWITEKDCGIYDAWNKGLKLASGEWISFLGSDDYYLPCAVEDYYNAITKNNKVDYDLVYSNVKLVNGEKTIRIINGTWSWKQFKRFMNFAHVGAFHNVRYFKEYGLFDMSYRIVGDYELLLRAKKNLKTLKLDKITAIMEDGGISNKCVKKVFLETFLAKRTSAGVNYIIAKGDYYLAFFKYYTRKFLNILK